MKKIAFVMPWILPMPPVKGGAVETLVQGIIDENEKQKQLDITVFTKANPDAQALYANYRHAHFVPIHVSKFEEKLAWFYRGVMNKVFHIPHTPGLAYLLRLGMAVRGKHFDRVVVQNQAPFVPMLKRMKAGEIDLHMHNIVILSEMVKPRRVADMCRVISVSDYISGWMQQNVGNPEEKCRILRNCVDVDAFRSGRIHRSDMRRKLGMKDDELMILFTGRLLPEKGALELARAFSKANLPNAKLVFVGSLWFGGNEANPYQTEIQNAIENCKDRVLFTGYVNHSDIPFYYAAADIAAMPSTWEEPAGLTVLEAQAAGLPVISTISGGIPEHVCPEGSVLVEKGEGLEARLCDAIISLANDPRQRREMSEKAMAWSLERNMENYYRRFVSLMTE